MVLRIGVILFNFLQKATEDSIGGVAGFGGK